MLDGVSSGGAGDELSPPSYRTTSGVLVALTSLCPQIGKSTVATMLTAELQVLGLKTVRLSFADTIKEMIDVLLSAFGINPPRRFAYLYGDKKEEVIPELGVSARQIMRTLGTDWAHPLLKPDVWARATAEKARRAMNVGVAVVIDDLRFKHELAAVRSLSGISVRIRRPEAEDLSSTHPSDVDMRQVEVEHTLLNDSSIEILDERVKQLAQAALLHYVPARR